MPGQTGKFIFNTTKIGECVREIRSQWKRKGTLDYFSDLRRLVDLFRSAHPFDTEAFSMRDRVLFQKNIELKSSEFNIAFA